MILHKPISIHTPDSLPTDAPPAYDDISFQDATTTGSAHTTPPSTTSPNLLFYSVSKRNKPLPAVVDNPSEDSESDSRSVQASRLPSVTNGTTEHSGSGSGFLQANLSQAPGPTLPKSTKLYPSLRLSPRSQGDVRSTVRAIICDIVRGSSPVRSSIPHALSVIQSCASACSSSSISFARILQERNIEDHAPIYWAVVSRHPVSDGKITNQVREDDIFLLELITHASPLTPSAVSELRSACLVAAGNALFQRLRSASFAFQSSGLEQTMVSSLNTQSPDGAGRHGVEDAVMGSNSKRFHRFDDVAYVREGRATIDVDSFCVFLELKMFQRRMRVFRHLEIEFIARGRLWQLIFFIVPTTAKSNPTSSSSTSVPDPQRATTIPEAARAAACAQKLQPGTWALVFALLEESWQCHAEARLIVPEPSGEPEDNILRVAGSNCRTIPTSADADVQASLRRGRGSAISTSILGFGKTAGGNSDRPRMRAPLVLNLGSSGPSPLIALPTPPWNTTSPLPEDLDYLLFSSKASKPKRRRPTRGEKRAVRKQAAKERRAREGCETRKEKKQRNKLAETVMLAVIGDPSVDSVKSISKKRAGTYATELLYDGCPYISPDGTLCAFLEVRLSSSPFVSDESGCVIC